MKSLVLIAIAVIATALGHTAAALAETDRPNILVIFGDDIGINNISAYGRGIIGYQPPNIDRIAKEGAIFTDYYGQQSCTAGRSAFITGQIPFRTGLSKVGLPGAPEGLQKEDPTIAELLKPLGYATGQFGRTTWATVTSSFRPCTASTNSSAISTTSMPKRNLRTRTILRTLSSERISVPEACCIHGPMQTEASVSRIRAL